MLKKQDLYKAKLLCTPIEKAMLHYLYIAQDGCGQLQISRAKLKEESGLSRDRARKATDGLVEKGILKITLRHVNGKQRDSLYTLL